MKSKNIKIAENRQAIFAEMRTKMSAAKKPLLLSHVRPDGDAIGSQLALGLTLKKLGKDVVILNESGVPESLEFLPKSNSVITPTQLTNTTLAEIDLIISLDTAAVNRHGEAVCALLDGHLRGLPWLNIDHHATNPEYGNVNFVDSEAAATGELIYEFCRLAAWSMDARVLECLYVAITTDTGSFKFPNTTAKTLRVVAELVESGVNIGDVSNNLYNKTPLRRHKLLAEFITNMELAQGGDLAICRLLIEQKKRLALRGGDTDSMINVALATDGVKVAVLFEEFPEGIWRVSLRSKDKRLLDVGELCAKYGGGGHSLAAGVTLQDEKQKVKFREELGRLISD